MLKDLTIDQIHAAQSGDDDAMMVVIDAHEGLIKAFIHAATQGAEQPADRDDLRQEARIALLMAVMDYRTDSPASLTTFAYQRLEGAVRSAWVAARPGLTAGTSTEQRVRRALYAADGDVEQAWVEVNAGRDAVKNRMTRETFDAAYQALSSMKSLDAQVNGGDGRDTKLTLADVVADPYASSMTERVEARMMVEQAFAAVSPRHEFVMRADYGIDVPVMETAEIADHLGVTPSRVRGVRRDALAAAFCALQA